MIINRHCAAALALSLGVACTGGFGHSAHAQAAPILSRTQITLAQDIEAVISIRMEPRRSELSTLLASTVEPDLPALFTRYFPDTPLLQPTKGEQMRRTEHGRLTCRLIARERDAMVAIFTRCTLGNLLVNIMNREDLTLVPRMDATQATRVMLEDAFRRIAYSYRKARGMKPVWVPDGAPLKREGAQQPQ